MRKVIITAATALSLLLPATAFASAKKSAAKPRHARSVKHVAKVKSLKRAKHADSNDRKLLIPKWS